MPDSHITANVRASHAKTMLTGSTWRQIAEFNTFFNEVKWAQVNLHLTTVKVFKDSQLKIPQSDYINFNNYGEKTRQHSYQVWSCARARTEVNFRSVFVYRAG